MFFRHKEIGRRSIKEAYDNLPAGMCCFNRQGLPILVNHTMDRLAFELMGHDLQYEAELSKAVELLEEKTLVTANGKAWRFHCRDIQEIGTEYMAVDVTDLYRDTIALREKNRQLQEMNEALAETARNYTAIVRQEEILSMKMRIHSEMGKCSLQLQKYYRDGCPGENKGELIERIRQAAALLKGEVGKTKQEDSLSELMETAKAVGAVIRINGQLPKEAAQVDLLIMAMRECLMNTIRHAGGNTLFTDIERTASGWRAELSNNGKAPAAGITEGGGLTSLRQKIEAAGGSMQIQTQNGFRLILMLPDSI